MKSSAAAAAAVLLSLLSLGHSAPLSTCDVLVKPITISKDDMLGRWLYIGGSSDIPGSRSLGHLLSSIWLDITATAQSNILSVVQSQRIYSECFNLAYNVTFENSAMLIEQPFYLKEVYLSTSCSDCLAVYEEVTSGKDTFTSLLLFSRRQSVSPADLEMLKTQAECLRMPPPIVVNKDDELCPDDLPPSDGLSVMNSHFKAKLGQRFARILDSLFDLFVN